MNAQDFKRFIKNDVLDAGVAIALFERNTHAYRVIVRFRNRLPWRNSNLKVRVDESSGQPVARIRFDVDGSCIAGTGDNGANGEINPDIAHFRVSGRFEATQNTEKQHCGESNVPLLA